METKNSSKLAGVWEYVLHELAQALTKQIEPLEI